MSINLKRPIKDAGNNIVTAPMTRDGARRWGDKHMPYYLKKAGFVTTVFASDPEIHGSAYFRVSYCRSH